MGLMLRAIRAVGLVGLGALAVAVLPGLPTPVSAADPQGGGQRGAMAACSVDLATFCPGVEAGGGKKMRCLTENQTRLAPGCAAAVAARRADRAARLGTADASPKVELPGGQPAVVAPTGVVPPVPAPVRANMRACRADMAALCGAIAAGGGAKVKCLMDNQAKLSPDCATAVSISAQQRQAAKAACTDDAAKFCASARGPARLQCLAANKAQLAPACVVIVEKRLARLDRGAK